MPADKDQLFIDIALEKGLLTQEQVDECAQAHTQATQLGVKITFTKLAQDRGLLSKDQITDIRREMAKRGVLPEFGGYELISKLGQGGMGAVYKARQIKLDRVVALKVLPAEMAANRQYIARFEREARLAAKVLHPNAVQVFDVGQEGVRHYIAMEFVDGSDVAKELTGGPMAEDRALQIIRGVAEALAVAHEQKIVHRDIKPANIMLTSRGTPKVADLGIAKQTGVHGGTLTRTGAAIGTPHYMSPEQCLGQKDIDCRSDIYSLGATLFHMVCGARPFEADTAMAVMRKQVDEASPDPREKNPNLSDASAGLIWRMMAKDREARFQTCTELIAAVDEILKGAGDAFIPSAEINEPRRRPTPPSRETTAKEASPVTSTRAGQAAAGTVLRTAADQPETVPAAATPKSIQWLVAVVGVFVLIAMAGVVGFMIYRSMRTLPSPTPREETAKPRPAEAPAAAAIASPKPGAAVREPVPPWAKVSKAQIDAAAKARVPVAKEITLGGGVTMKMVFIPPGEFMMGSSEPASAISADMEVPPGLSFANEYPRHRVRIERPFYLGIHEVTNAQFKTMDRSHDSGTWRRFALSRPDQPVVQVDAESITNFLRNLSEKEGVRYRLPTEAEWEYACRAGSSSRFWWGQSNARSAKCANAADLAATRTWSVARVISRDDGHAVAAPVGAYMANGFGLYDMLGNVWEVCRSRLEPYPYRREFDIDGFDRSVTPVSRGGSWSGHLVYSRCSCRVTPDMPSTSVGFRIVCEVGTGLGDTRLPPEAPKPAAVAQEAVPAWAEVSKLQIEAAKRAGAPVAKEIDLGGGVTMKFVLIPPGEFMMGSRESAATVARKGRWLRESAARELPRHRVRLTRGFYMAVHETTVGQFRRFVAETGFKSQAETDGGSHGQTARNSDFVRRAGVTWQAPGYGQSESHPVGCMGWRDTQEFVKWLSTRTGRECRLPTEAEWEYACRAGANTPFHHGETLSTDQANVNPTHHYGYGQARGVYRGHATAVGSFAPNGWGLYDMHGNLYEWCSGVGDYSSIPVTDPSPAHNQMYRVLRGGSWSQPAVVARSTRRNTCDSGTPYTIWGFRVVCEAAPVPRPARVAEAPTAAPAPPTDEVIFYDDFSNGLARWDATATVRSTKDGVVDYSCGRHTGIRLKGEIPVENVVIQWRGAAFQNGFAAHFGPYYVDIGGWNNTASATCGPGAPQRIKRTGRVWKPGHFHIYEIRRVGDDLIGAIDGKVVIRRQITARSKSGRLRFTTWNARLKIDWVRVIRKQPKTKPAAAAVDESKSASAPSASRAEAPSPELDKGLVAHYALEGNLRDHTPNRNDGSASGHVRYVQGVTGQALQFGGVKSPAHVMIRKSPSLALGNEMAMSFFLRVDDPTAHDGWGKPISYRGQQYVFAADGDGAGICLFVYVDKASRLTCQFKNMKTHTTPLFLIDAAMDYRLHDWVHVAAVHNGKDAILYLNGNETARKSAPANLHTAGGKNVFLGRMGTHWYPLNGAIDDFRWYNRALSPNEVRALAATVAQPRVGKTVETRRGVPADRAASTELRIELSGVRGWSLGRVARGQRISTSRHYVFTSFPSEIANVAHVRRPHSQICHGLPGGAVRLSRDAWAYVAVNTYYKTRPVGVKEVARMRRSGWKTVSGRFSTTTTGRERWGWTLFRKRVSKGPVTLPAVKLGTSKIFMFK